MNNWIGLFKYSLVIRHQFKRFRYKKKWAINYNEKTSIDHALNYFDIQYGPVFDKNWRSIRLALLSRQKYCALLNNFCEICCSQEYDEQVLTNIFGEEFEENTFEFVHRLFDEGASNKYSLIERNKNLEQDNEINKIELLSEHTPVTTILSEADKLKAAELAQLNQVFKKSNVQIESSISFTAPKMLKALTFHKGDISQFPPSKQDKKSGKLMYYLMDASSILPVLCLNLFPGCSVLDMCAAPGGKMLAMVFTMLPEKIVCIDKSYTRMQRLKDVIRSYLPKLYLKENIIETHVCDALEYTQNFTNQFDRVLVDVPCFADRHAVTEDGNSLFVPNRRADRLMMPNLQLELLINGIKSCKINGIIVYSTCTLSPIQNDSIVAQAIEHQEASNSKVVVEDTGCIARAFDHVFNFSQNCNYGQLVIPHMTKNFGPMYLSVLKKLS